LIVSLPVQFAVTDQSGQRDSIYLSLLADVEAEKFEEFQKKKQSSSIWDFFGN